MSERKTYSREFKLEALRLWEHSAKSAREIETDLGISAGLLAKWKRRQQDAGPRAFGGHGVAAPGDERVRQLEREVEILKQEREILKKAVAIFSQPPR